MIVEILATEVLRRSTVSHKIHPISLVDRVMSEELVEEDEDLRLQVIDRILELTREKRPTGIQSKAVLTFLWAIHPHAPKPERFAMRAVRRRKAATQQLSLLIEEPPIPTMQKDGMVIFL